MLNKQKLEERRTIEFLVFALGRRDQNSEQELRAMQSYSVQNDKLIPKNQKKMNKSQYLQNLQASRSYMSKTTSMQNSSKFLNQGKHSMPKIYQAGLKRQQHETIVEEDEGVAKSGQNIKFPLIK